MKTIQEIDKELEFESAFEMSGFVRQLQCRNYLMPLFEAVINSMQSIQLNNVSNGLIEVHINRLAVQEKIGYNEEIGYKVQPIDSITITDNGVGFTNANMKSLRKAYYTEKIQLGCKGIGRFSWLKAFDSVYIESAFREQGKIHKRTFPYLLPNGIDLERYTCEELDDNTQSRTTVKLIGLKKQYLEASSQRIDTIAKKLLEHCFYYVSSENSPRIVVSGYDCEQKDKQAKAICLNELYDENYSKNIKIENINIKEINFELKHIKLFDTGEENKHRVYFCGNNRAVTDDTVKNITKLNSLESKIQDLDSDRKFYYVSYASSQYLDENTDDERLGFKLPERDASLDIPNILSLNEIKKGIAPSLISYISPYLESAEKTKIEKISEVVNNQIPQYNYLLKEDAGFFDDISVNSQPEEIKNKVRIKHINKRDQINEQIKKIIDKNDRSFLDDDGYEEEYKKLAQEINDIGKADLAEYVIYRKTVLKYFEKYLGVNKDDNKLYHEKFIHNLIYPMGKTSDDVPYEKHNLWIIDDKLAFSDYIASDKPIRTIDGLGSSSREEIDLGFFDCKNIYSDDVSSSTYDSVTIIEFKRPERKNYSVAENPISQVYNYIDEIKTQKVNNKDGRTIKLSKNARFYGYIICDINDDIRKFAQHHNFVEMPDGMGYYCYNSDIYMEILCFDKVLLDCKKRNEIMFKKLNLKD